MRRVADILKKRYPLFVTAAMILSPFAIAPGKLLAFAPWILVATAMLVTLTQPTPPPADLARSALDRRSGLFVFVACNLTILICPFGVVTGLEVPAQALSPAFLAGTLIVCTGVALRIWSIRVLGPFFTAVVTVTNDQRLVRDGPYRFIRHPSYAGIVLAFIGISIIFQSIATLAATLLLIIPAYRYRIQREEAALRDRFGFEYMQYRSQTGAMWPALVSRASFSRR